jgi:hypothetical protein
MAHPQSGLELHRHLEHGGANRLVASTAATVVDPLASIGEIGTSRCDRREVALDEHASAEGVRRRDVGVVAARGYKAVVRIEDDQGTYPRFRPRRRRLCGAGHGRNGENAGDDLHVSSVHCFGVSWLSEHKRAGPGLSMSMICPSTVAPLGAEACDRSPAA